MLIMEEKPVSLNSLKFSNSNGEMIVSEGYMLTFGNSDLAEKFIQHRYKYWKKRLNMDLVIAPNMNETINELEVVKVFKLTARHFNILYRYIMSKGRRKEYVEARRIAINICKGRHVQDAVISRVTKMDHSTIVHHKKRFKELIESEKGYVEMFSDCEEYVLERLDNGTGEKLV
jgi:hypothetical protein